jgi:hypothetical protein
MADTIYQVLAKIQYGLKAPKSQYSSFGKHTYRSCEDILTALKPHLHDNGAYLVFDDVITVIGERQYVKSVAKLGLVEGSFNDIVSADGYAREPECKPKMDESQTTGSAITYARKYALGALLLIDDTKDADTLENGGKRRKVTDGDHFRKKVISFLTLAANLTDVTETFEQFKDEATELSMLDWLRSEANKTVAIITEEKDMDNRGSNS